ncbi:hypothetical protein C8Q75DRAFT_795268 [Abortiporus biennis]|nr:hypothetical protein C8Q75DRAFT_795268 [Abortiporus biennis]
MTEYTTSSDAIREYMSARERTAHWVESHAHHQDAIFLSPSSPPSVLSDSDGMSYGPSDSDAASSHSLPPRMVLRYEDGRPDVPISNDYSPSHHAHSRSKRHGHSGSPTSQSPSYNSHHSSHHSRSRSGHQAPVPPTEVPVLQSQSLSYATIPAPPRPESIVILPSRESEDSTHSSGRAAPPVQAAAPSVDAHSRAPTLQTVHADPQIVPQGTYAQPSVHPSASPRSRQHSHAPTHDERSRHGGSVRSHHTAHPSDPSHGVSHHGSSHSHSRSHVTSQLPYSFNPPAIIYAPSSDHSRSHYAPPAIVYSPPSHPHQTHMNGRYPAPGMTYSQSDPLPRGVHATGSHAGRHSVDHRSHRSAIREETRDEYDHYERSRSRSRGHHDDYARGRHTVRESRRPHESRSPSRSPTEDDARSVSSGGTYYVIPTPGQKVQIIVPNPRSVYTATSTTKSAHSPQSANSLKKPFFQRIFHFPGFRTPSVDSKASNGSKANGHTPRRLQRRHTISHSHHPHEDDDLP